MTKMEELLVKCLWFWSWIKFSLLIVVLVIFILVKRLKIKMGNKRSRKCGTHMLQSLWIFPSHIERGCSQVLLSFIDPILNVFSVATVPNIPYEHSTISPFITNRFFISQMYKLHTKHACYHHSNPD